MNPAKINTSKQGSVVLETAVTTLLHYPCNRIPSPRISRIESENQAWNGVQLASSQSVTRLRTDDIMYFWAAEGTPRISSVVGGRTRNTGNTKVRRLEIIAWLSGRSREAKRLSTRVASQASGFRVGHHPPFLVIIWCGWWPSSGVTRLTTVTALCPPVFVISSLRAGELSTM